jgi:hypothetical protein
MLKKTLLIAFTLVSAISLLTTHSTIIWFIAFGLLLISVFSLAASTLKVKDNFPKNIPKFKNKFRW